MSDFVAVCRASMSDFVATPSPRATPIEATIAAATSSATPAPLRISLTRSVSKATLLMPEE